MNEFIHVLKEHSLKAVLPIIVFIIGSIPTVLGVAFYLDGRYAHATDIQKIQQLSDQNFQELRRRTLSDKLFEIDFKVQSNQASALDKALREKYLRELDELNSAPSQYRQPQYRQQIQQQK